MTNNKLNNEVGKKIVEALKQQSGEEMMLEQAEVEIDENEVTNDFDSEFTITETVNENESQSGDDFFAEVSQGVENTKPLDPNILDNVFNADAFESFNQQQQFEHPETETTTFEIPSNIAVLKKLISQLPSGVTRHTGAQIIKQTMEALGISMKSVLNEAQQVQESLKVSAKECQTTIQEYKKQIVALEKQSQTYQKQYGALNDLISLFIQTTK